MKVKTIGSFSLMVVAVLSVISCSVKEDRSDCPCLLRIDMSDNTSMPCVKVIVIDKNGTVLSAMYTPKAEASEHSKSLVDSDTAGDLEYSENSGNYLSFKIQRGPAKVIAVSGDSDLLDVDSGLEIPLGKECPPLYSYSTNIDASGEYCEKKVTVHKNYCRISVEMVGEHGQEYPYDVGLVGRIAGYDLDMQPVEGVFDFEMEKDSQEMFHGSVPRQKDSSLILRVSKNGMTVRDFAIGEYMHEGGYDWTSLDLVDVKLRIDYANLEMTFDNREWENSFSFNVAI